MKRHHPDKKTAALLLIAVALLYEKEAQAMHIAEGILPLNRAALWFVIALPFVVYGLYRLKIRSREDFSLKPLVGLMAAVVFIISALPIPVPFAGTCIKPQETSA